MNAQTEQDNSKQVGLNRRVNLTAIPLETLAWFIVAAIALGTSLIGRTRWPLSEQESSIARDAWALVQGNDLTPAADAHPAIVQLTAFMFFLFGDTDYTARVIPLLAGVAMLGTLYWLRGWFGSLPAICIAILWTISPVMSLSLLRLDAGAILVVASLLAFVLTASITLDSNRGRAIVLGVSFGVGLTVHPLGWIVLPLSVLAAMILIRDVRLGGQAIPAIGSMLITVVIMTTWFLTRLTAPVSFLSESFRALWSDHLSSLGEVMQAPIITLIVDEPLMILLGLAGVFILAIRPTWEFSVHPAVLISCIAWALPMLTVGLLATGKGPGLYAVSLFPLVVVAGLGLSLVLDGVRAHWNDDTRPLLWTGIALALIVAIVRIADQLAEGPAGDTTGWIVNVLAVLVLILGPLGYLIIRQTAGTGWTFVPIALLAIVVVFGAIGLRTSLVLPDTSQDRPGDLLRAGNTSPGVGSLQHRLRTFSRDATTHIQDVRDPTGGHGLMIVVHPDLANPIAWYFRDFPNLAIIDDPSGITTDPAPDAAFIPAGDLEEWDPVFEQHASREYPLRYSPAADISVSTLNGLILSAVNPVDARHMFRYSIHRSNPALLEQDSMVMLLRDDHADAFWGTGADAS